MEAVGKAMNLISIPPIPRPKPRQLFLGLLTLTAITVGGMSYITINRPTPVVNPTTPAKPATISALGRLEPNGEVIQVFAPTSLDGARVEQLRVRLGQRLQPGNVIAILDTYARRGAALQEALAQVRVAQSQLQQIQAGAKIGQIQAQQRVVERLQVEQQTRTAAQRATIARIQSELSNAELENRRYQAEGVVSASLRDSKQLLVATLEQQLHEAQAEFARIQQSYQMQIAEARATLDQIAEVRPVDVAVARARLTQTQASLAQAKANLDLAVVRAPQAGQVLKIHARPGELVGKDGLISLGQTQQMVAVAEVYETDLSRVRLGQPATVTSKNLAFTDVLHGRVSEVGLEIRKQDVLNTDPAAAFDARVVEVRVLLDPASSRRVAGLTNLSVLVEISQPTAQTANIKAGGQP
jgi:HlyD family secretion protein